MIDKIPEFKNQKLLQQALTHRSYLNENYGDEEDNESLEFIGDALLGFLVGELLYRRYKEEHNLKPKELTRIRSLLVDEKQLAKFAVQLGIGAKMRLGKGAEKDGGRKNPALLSDTFEAIIGAYFLDSNLTKVKPFIKRLFEPVADHIILPNYGDNSQPKDLVDTKGKFQQWALAKFGENPRYESNDGEGLDHAKIFTAEVRVRGKLYGVGKGYRKQEAEKSAAEKALKKVGLI
ncbi:MAG: ribonuclease III [Trichodesmium sp. St16_bin4-tuft]|nr:ribonuclease III [Trichodesmium sp. MAG_R01]MDE5073271.1 ribonuclease III [Trichodesmium sp. St5_bin8]MDE5091775.1 ribonuclease III [Trichodesmium sp. St18_bin3_1_1]MDE5098180.1 ribonuclease III [Trichodesmium sp. St16_bin4-tuft]MDE5104774.1 ribonuclease III [Trichodesmium sp. St19_bin2]